MKEALPSTSTTATTATTLNAAKQTFDDAKQTAVVDKSALREAVDAAIDPTDIQASEDGSDVPDKKKWATAEDLDAYKTALNTAKEVLAATDATQNGVYEVLQNLNSAAEKIQTVNVVRDDLKTSIDDATALKETQSNPPTEKIM